MYLKFHYSEFLDCLRFLPPYVSIRLFINKARGAGLIQRCFPVVHVNLGKQKLSFSTDILIEKWFLFPDFSFATLGVCIFLVVLYKCWITCKNLNTF